MSDALLPPNATIFEQSLEGTISRVSDVPVIMREMQNPNTCPVDVLPWLAWAFNVDQWDPTWTEAQKRATINAAFYVNSHKGTVGAVTSALAALGIGLQVVEWFNDTPEAAPYTFRLTLTATQNDVPQAQLGNAQNVVNSTKNLRSHLTSISVNVESDCGIYFGGGLCLGNDITIASGN